MSSSLLMTTPDELTRQATKERLLYGERISVGTADIIATIVGDTGRVDMISIIVPTRARRANKGWP